MHIIPTEQYTKIPNAILENMHEFSHLEFKVLMTVFRHTLGWNRLPDGSFGTRDRAKISISQFIKTTGASKQGVIDCLKSLKDRGYIYKTDQGEIALYLNSLDQSNQQVVNSVDMGSQVSRQGVSSQLTGVVNSVDRQQPGNEIISDVSEPLKKEKEREKKEKESPPLSTNVKEGEKRKILEVLQKKGLTLAGKLPDDTQLEVLAGFHPDAVLEKSMRSKRAESEGKPVSWDSLITFMRKDNEPLNPTITAAYAQKAAEELALEWDRQKQEASEAPELRDVLGQFMPDAQ